MREGTRTMTREFARYAALVLAAALIVGILFHSRITRWFVGDRALAAGEVSKATNSPSERKVLYWYDAMKPENHYDKPGKAPDGMDLVAKYDESASTGGSDMANMPGMDT